MANTMQAFGGLISWRTGQNSVQKPYEMNIALYDALKGTHNGEDQYNFARFICAHSVMLSLQGIPGIYIHSLLATQNDYEKFEHTNHNRAINRHRWHYDDLADLLANPYSHHQKVLTELKRILALRIAQNAFHPNAIQVVLQLGSSLFGVMRQCHNNQQTIFCVANITDESRILRLSELNLISSEFWYDLLSDKTIDTISGDYPLKPYQVLWLTNNKRMSEQ
jgi:sucrose phosphorylase